MSAQGKTDKCIAHGGGKKCNEPNCKASARDNSNKCIAHGGGKRCNEPYCKSSAQGKSDKCIAHGGGKRCNEPNCKKGAEGKSDKCAAHGGGNRCPNCIDWIDSRSGCLKYDGYCATCFKRIFPNDQRSKIIHSHTKEIMVRNAINTNFEGFIHDRPLYTGNCDCSHRRRIEHFLISHCEIKKRIHYKFAKRIYMNHRKLIGNTILAVETDEFGHRGYNQYDEEIRYHDLFMIHSGKWIFIRFNPDNNISKLDIDDKLDKLIETINDCIDRIENNENTELLEIYKLYC